MHLHVRDYNVTKPSEDDISLNAAAEDLLVNGSVQLRADGHFSLTVIVARLLNILGLERYLLFPRRGL